MHNITFCDGQISMIMRNKDIFLDFYQNKIPTFCTDESGRTLADGIYINKTLEHTQYDCALLMPRFVNKARQYGENYGKNSLHIVVREKDCQHFYCLFFDLEEHDFLQWTINNGQIVKDIIANYNLSFHDFIIEAKDIENRIILPTGKDFLSSFSNKKVYRSNIALAKIIHKSLNIPVHFSRRQSECLVMLSEGKTAKEIAMFLGLSPRTIEYYFQSIRKQLGCYSNKKLIADYGEQIVLLNMI